ncbi:MULTISPECIES: TetR family transcriptional regulator [unclassified Bacillus (in: firmicutes)]|uniref:TetR family transcriptional regulator n=1 Tax=unclassified Bacillus (in: firmicutes) TaxID=185979 RepID=UPI0008EEF4EE|nr:MULTISPECIES: TetR family transcriptional regulator [unclassified Bacillus (in: firmicutes)]SFA77987.1 DNA-binding transcriptional regulator, AcrR family [Bacillus sp. UNCCL13]SFQ67874.1 DNA-binding transcriptional regulator, AcrR family [Bacillus sp. cl95]
MADQPLTKEIILDTAEQVLRRFGPEKTSVVDVARALKVSHGSIYRHFPSKASLREAVAEKWLHSISEPLATVFNHDCSSTERLYLWLKTLIQIKHNLVQEDPELFTMYTSLVEESVEAVSAHIAELIGQIIPIIEDGIAKQEFKSGDAVSTASGVFMATAKFHHPAHAKEWLSPTIDQEFETVWNLILSGII